MKVWSDAVLEHVLAELPFLAAPQFEHSLAAWVRAEARCLILSDWLDRVGLIDAELNLPRPQVDMIGRLETTAARASERLGLDPPSYLALEKALAETRGGTVDRHNEDGLTTAELLGNAALGVLALVAIWAVMQQLGVDIVEWIRAQLISG
jgi:hypothetical protein